MVSAPPPKFKLIPDRMIYELHRTLRQAQGSTCTIYTNNYGISPGAASDGFGGQRITAIPRLFDIPVYVARAALVTPELRINADQIAPDISWLALLPPHTELYDHDIIVWGDEKAGGIIQVVSVLPATYETVRRAYCRLTSDFNPAHVTTTSPVVIIDPEP